MVAGVRGESSLGTLRQHLLDLLAIHRRLLCEVSLFRPEGLSQVFLLLDGEFELASGSLAHWKGKLGLVLRAGEDFMYGLDRSDR